MSSRTAKQYKETIISTKVTTGKVTEKITTTPITSQLMVKLSKQGDTETLNDMARSIKTLQKKFGLPQTGTMNGMVAKQLSNLGKGTLSKKTGGANAISPRVFAGLGITIDPPISAGFEGSTSAVLTEIIGTTIGAAKIAAPVGVFLYILLKPTTTAGVPEDIEKARIQEHINEAEVEAKSKEDDIKVGKLKPLPKDKIKDLGGEDYTQPTKLKTGKSKSDLYWNPQTGDVYTIPKSGGPPQYVDNIPKR